MQKFFVIFVLLCAFFMVSCGDGSSSKTDGTGNGGSSAAKTGKLGGECYPNETCDKGLICDTDNNLCVKDPEDPADDSDKTDSGSDGKTDTGSENGDTDSTDSGHENHDSGDSEQDDSDTSDSGSDSGDLQPANDADQGDSQSGNDTDPGDSQPDDDNADSEDDSSEDLNPLNLPVCSKTSGTPCIYKGLLIWSAKSPERKRWIDAVEHCKKLTEGGFNDWRLPDVDLLGTLIQNCDSAGSGCTGNSNGDYSVFGDITFFWSSSEYGNSKAGGIYFYNASAQLKNVDETFDVRCVRIETTSVNKKCDEIPENAVYNSVSSITLTWDWENYWTPSTKATYSEEPSTTECRFKCKDNYVWDSSTEECVISPCSSNPCGEYSCLANSPTTYSCECQAGYYWWGIEKGCIDKRRLTLGEICTGQDKCYGNSSSMTCPSSTSADFYGQDAQYTSECTAQSFSSSSNVVVDNNTGLTWEKSPSSSSYTWDNRATHCSELNSSNYGGISNWRVPNPLELLTIVNNSTYSPATNSNFTGMPTDSSIYFWTSKEYPSDTSVAFYCSMYYGGCYPGTNGTKTESHKVLCVSGNEMPKGVFSSQTISGSVVVTDSTTGLMWQKEYATGKTWQEALKYCEDSTYAGYSDWRLPNKNEAASLLNYNKSAAPYSDFPDMPSNDFWSSSTGVGSTNLAWDVSFNCGGVGNNYKTNNYYVRCVRNAE